MFGIDAVIILVAFVTGIFLFWTFTTILSASFETFAGPIFLSIPLIGNISCDPNSAEVDHPAYPFGVPGQNTIGCLEGMLQWFGLITSAIIATFYLAATLLLKVSPWFEEKMGKYVGINIAQLGRAFMGSAIAIILIVLWPHINDNTAIMSTQSAYNIASFPHEKPGVYTDPAQKVKNAETTIVYSFHLLTDSTVGNHECFAAYDSDGDGLKDSFKQPSFDCLKNHLFSLDFGNTIMALIMGGNIKGILTITVYTSSIVRLIVTGIVGAFMPTLISLSIFPIVGKTVQPLAKAYILMLLCPILIAGAFTIGDELIVKELNYLHTLHPTDMVAEKNVAFILALGVPMSALAMITFCMSFLAGPTLMIGGMAMMGISKMWEGAMKLGSAIVGGTGQTGENFATTVGHTMTMTGTGSGGGSFSFGGESGNAERVPPSPPPSDDVPPPSTASSENEGSGDSGDSGSSDGGGGGSSE